MGDLQAGDGPPDLHDSLLHQVGLGWVAHTSGEGHLVSYRLLDVRLLDTDKLPIAASDQEVSIVQELQTVDSSTEPAGIAGLAFLCLPDAGGQ